MLLNFPGSNVTFLKILDSKNHQKLVFWRYHRRKNKYLPPLTYSDFHKIWTVTAWHHKLLPPKISWQSNYVKTPKLDFKVKKRHIEFGKNQLLHKFNAKLCKGRVNHDPKTVVGVVDDHQKKFQPLFIISCFSKKTKKTWIGKYGAVWDKWTKGGTITSLISFIFGV